MYNFAAFLQTGQQRLPGKWWMKRAFPGGLIQEVELHLLQRMKFHQLVQPKVCSFSDYIQEWEDMPPRGPTLSGMDFHKRSQVSSVGSEQNGFFVTDIFVMYFVVQK